MYRALGLLEFLYFGMIFLDLKLIVGMKSFFRSLCLDCSSLRICIPFCLRLLLIFSLLFVRLFIFSCIVISESLLVEMYCEDEFEKINMKIDMVMVVSRTDNKMFFLNIKMCIFSSL